MGSTLCRYAVGARGALGDGPRGSQQVERANPTLPSLTGPSDPTAVRAVVQGAGNPPAKQPRHTTLPLDSSRYEINYWRAMPSLLFFDCLPSSSRPRPPPEKLSRARHVRVPQVTKFMMLSSVKDRQRKRGSRRSPSGCVSHHQDAAEDAHCTLHTTHTPDRVRHASTSTHAPCCSV